MSPLLRNTLRTFDSLSFGRNVYTPAVANSKIEISNSLLAHTRARFGSYRSISQQVGGSSSIRQQIVSANQLGLADVRICSKTASLNQRFCTQKLETYQARAFSSSNQSHSDAAKTQETAKDSHQETENDSTSKEDPIHQKSKTEQAYAEEFEELRQDIRKLKQFIEDLGLSLNFITYCMLYFIYLFLSSEIKHSTRKTSYELQSISSKVREISDQISKN